MTLHTAIEKFHRRLVITKRPSTVNYYQFYFSLLKRHLGDVAITTLDEERLLTLIMQLKQHHPEMKHITMNKALSALKTILKYSANHHVIIPKLTETKLLIPTITQPTIDRILTHYQSSLNHPVSLRNYLIVKILLETGLRMHELLHLRKTQIDLGSQTILVAMTKTNAHRIVCFKEETVAPLQQWLALHPEVPWLFYHMHAHVQLTTSAVESMFYQLKQKLKITDNITPHKWRHTFATYFLRRGGDLETLRLFLGHSNLKTTQKYLHLTEIDLRNQYRSIMETFKK